MPTKVLVFESDAGFADILRRELSALDCEVTIVDDAGMGLQAAARDRPDLILLAIELPRMNGFSVCNKLKRDPGLKDVPLVIMSTDSSEETFEQHRRLRTRAEDYVHKPVAFSDLLARIRPFVPIGVRPPQADAEEEILIEEDLQIDDSGVVEVADAELLLEPEITAIGARVGSVQPEPEITSVGERIASIAPELGIEIADAEILPESAAPRPPSMLPLSSAPPISESSRIEIAEAEVLLDQRLSEMPRSPEPSVEPPADLSPSQRPSSFPARLSAADAEITRLREELERSRARTEQLERDAHEVDSRVLELKEQLRQAGSQEAELVRLRAELEEAHKRPPSIRGGSSAREFLDLREQLNRKDKELLDVRDQLTHRDKELVVVRDSVLELERHKADTGDKLADLERQSAELRRLNDALANDKDAASKRAEDFKKRSEKLKTDLDAKTAEYVELRAQFEAELAARTAREAELETQAQADLEKAVLATEASERQRAEAQLQAAQEQASSELSAALAAAADTAATTLRDTLAAREAELNANYATHVGNIERAASDSMQKLRAEFDLALSEAESAAAAALSRREAELEAARQSALSALAREHSEILLLRDSQSAAALSERDQHVQRLERELGERTVERDEARRDIERRKLRIEGLETDLSQVRGLLESTQYRLAELEQQFAQTAQALEQRNQETTQLTARTQELSTSLASVEVSLATTAGELTQTRAELQQNSEILGRARAKLSADRASLERTKDALAAALAQVDEVDARSFE